MHSTSSIKCHRLNELFFHEFFKTLKGILQNMETEGKFPLIFYEVNATLIPSGKGKYK
jgi:hypothetical protein